NKDSYGVDRLVVDFPGMNRHSAFEPPALTPGGAPPGQSWSAFLPKTPLSDGAKAGLLKLFTDKTDYLRGSSTKEKIERLMKMSHVDYLLKLAEIHPDAVAFIQAQDGLGGNNQSAGPATYSAWFAYRHGNAGFAGLGLPIAAQQISSLVKDPGRHLSFP